MKRHLIFSLWLSAREDAGAFLPECRMPIPEGLISRE
jgi:hypothetical protein